VALFIAEKRRCDILLEALSISKKISAWAENMRIKCANLSALSVG